jgi:arylsulfatase A-like enzyme
MWTNVILSLLTALQGPATAQRNVLLVVADDLGTDKLAVYEPLSAPPPTPTIDALAAQGVRFTNAWSCPLCSPTRASLMTGRLPGEHGVGAALPLGPGLPLAEVTIPEALVRALPGDVTPYALGAFGKWHLSEQGDGGQQAPNLQGFEQYAGSLPGAFVQPQDYEHWIRVENGQPGLSTAYATSVNVDDALEFIGAQNGPWFCYLAFNAPHTPFHAPPAELHTQSLPPVEPASQPVPFYNAMVEALDQELGRLLAGLPPAVMANTTVILIGDNGSTGAVVLPPYDPAKAKGTLYQGGVRVPLIVSGAGIVAPGRALPGLVQATDLFATVLELCGADLASIAAELPPLDTVSLVPYLQAPLSPSLRTVVRTELRITGADFDQSLSQPPGGGLLVGQGGGLIAGAQLMLGSAARNQTFKLIRPEFGPEELYNLLLDPREQVDLLKLPGLTPQARLAYRELSAALDSLE